MKPYRLDRRDLGKIMNGNCILKVEKVGSRYRGLETSKSYMSDRRDLCIEDWILVNPTG